MVAGFWMRCWSEWRFVNLGIGVRHANPMPARLRGLGSLELWKARTKGGFLLVRFLGIEVWKPPCGIA